MIPKERATNMITKIKERIDKCEPMIAILSNQTSEFIEDSYNERKIDTDTFNDLRHMLKTTVNQFPLNCSCIKKIPGESKLILPLKEMPKIESKIIQPPKMYRH